MERSKDTDTLFNDMEIFKSIPIISPEKFDINEMNVINLSQRPIYPIICISDLRLYYSPSDICNYISQFYGQNIHVMLFITKFSPSFIVLIKVDSIALAAELLSKVREHPAPISSMDTLHFDFFHSFSFSSPQLKNLGNSFLKEDFSTNKCVICLNKCGVHDLFTFPCSHTLHIHCVSRMVKWECPVCRYAPISSLNIASCEICGSFDRPYICLHCVHSFCYTHSIEHFQKCNHAYVASADGRETLNLLSRSSIQRIAMDKSGEFVEMCAKDDQLHNYLDAAIIEQVEIHRTINQQNIHDEAEKFQTQKSELELEIKNKSEKLKKMKELIENKKILLKKKDIAQNILKKQEKDAQNIEIENEKLRQENESLQKEIDEQRSLLMDMQSSAQIAVMAKYKRKNEEIHVRLNTK